MLRLIVFAFVVGISATASAQLFDDGKPSHPQDTKPTSSLPAGNGSMPTRHPATNPASPATSPTSKPVQTQKERDIQGVTKKLIDLRVAEAKEVILAKDRIKTNRRYTEALKAMKSAEAFKDKSENSPTATREQKFNASQLLNEAIGRLSDVEQSLIDADPQIAALRKSIAQASKALNDLNTCDLIDSLGNKGGFEWEFKGNAICPILRDVVIGNMQMRRRVISFPVDVSNHFVLTIQIRKGDVRTSPSMDIIIPVSRGTIVCELDSWRRYADEAAKVMYVMSMSHGGALITGSGMHEISIDSTGEDLHATFDGRPISNWNFFRGGCKVNSSIFFPTDLAQEMPHPHRIAIGVSNGAIEIMAVKLREIHDANPENPPQAQPQNIQNPPAVASKTRLRIGMSLDEVKAVSGGLMNLVREDVGGIQIYNAIVTPEGMPRWGVQYVITFQNGVIVSYTQVTP